MILVRKPELHLRELLRLVVTAQLSRQRDFTFLQIGAYDGVGDDDLRNLVKDHRLRGVMVEPQPEAFCHRVGPV